MKIEFILEKKLTIDGEETVLYPELPRIEYEERDGRYIRGKYSYVSECADVSDFFLDTETCELLGLNQIDFIKAMGSRIGVIRLREVTADVMRAINGSSFDGTLILDYSDRREYVPTGLRKDYEKYVYHIGEYIKWAFSMDELVKKHDKRVLFGAGNMCRNYMLMYGEEYPPLFTCDNNPKRWGGFIDGLEIKNPEELKKLDDDVAIYICNMYWNEVEAQIKAMGIKNPVEKFNDDYLPKTHKDRMEMWKGND